MLTPSREQPAIILVDDSPAVRSILERALGLAFPNHPIIVCSEAMQALDILADLGAAVVIADYYMPGMGGLDLCRSIRRSFPETFLIVTTAAPDASFQQSCDEAGVDVCVTKLFSLERIEQAVRHGLGLLQPAVRAAAA